MKFGDLIPTWSEESQGFLEKYFAETSILYDFFGFDIKKTDLVFKGTELIQADHMFKVPPRCQALLGNTHGGAVAFYMDAIMGVSLGFGKMLPQDCIVQTRQMEVEILKPVRTGKNLAIIARVTKSEEDRKFWFEAKILDGENRLATAKGFFLKAPISKMK